MQTIAREKKTTTPKSLLLQYYAAVHAPRHNKLQQQARTHTHTTVSGMKNRCNLLNTSILIKSRSFNAL